MLQEGPREHGEPEAAGPFFGCRSMSEWVANISFTTTDELIARGKAWCATIGLDATDTPICETDINSAFCVTPTAGETCKDALTPEIIEKQAVRIAKLRSAGAANIHCTAHWFSDYLRGRWQTPEQGQAADEAWGPIDDNTGQDVRDCFTSSFQFLRKQAWFKKVKIDFADAQLRAEIACRRKSDQEAGDYKEPSDCIDNEIAAATAANKANGIPP